MPIFLSFYCPVLGWFYHVLLPVRGINCENCQLSTGAINLSHGCYQPVTHPHKPLWFKKIRKTTTTAYLISNTVVPNPYIHSIAFDPQFYSVNMSSFNKFSWKILRLNFNNNFSHYYLAGLLMKKFYLLCPEIPWTSHF